MPELKDALERVATRFPGATDLRTLERRRTRRRRRERLLAGSLALAIAAVGTASAYIALSPTRAGNIADHPPSLGPDVLRVECSSQGPVVHTPEVRPQRDGLHIEAANTSDEVFIYGVRKLEGRNGTGHRPRRNALDDRAVPARPG